MGLSMMGIYYLMKKFDIVMMNSVGVGKLVLKLENMFLNEGIIKIISIMVIRKVIVNMEIGYIRVDLICVFSVIDFFMYSESCLSSVFRILFCLFVLIRL